MKIAVIGGSGHIGTRLVAALARHGHDVRAYATSAGRGEAAPLDVRDADALTRALTGADGAINLAAPPPDARGAALHDAVTVGGATNLVRAAAANGVARLAFVSTVAVYGLDAPLAREDAPLAPFDDYGRAKARAESIYAAWAAAGANRDLTIVRPSAVFGEHGGGNVRALIDHLARERFVMVGDGANRKSIAYVGNLADFVAARLDAAAGVQVYNYADKPDLSTRELIAKIRALLPAPGREPAHVPYALALAGGYACDALAALVRRPFALGSARVRKFRAETTVNVDAALATGFVARVSLDEALSRTVASVLKGP
ncbi:NAD-dependent epimerase/dehydratase family protein [Tahibacter soli]|uniref:NAD-dependent epimerase/dehydratase family protein n=1 Tax=Tahibacter soli TaxID=2983605 RepID=A0A9X4BJM9_9GAMM|nr:NAD-dependent epimerase/dehydratase family protein [Tahibacter soli]MDC8014848.1 NAD-dependent epimerase/dehydratase family protein [Tahibacter soli]